MSVRFKLLCGFGFLVALALMLAYAAVGRTNELGRMVVEVYDRPLMSINHARSAQTGFYRALSIYARDNQRPRLAVSRRSRSPSPWAKSNRISTSSRSAS